MDTYGWKTLSTGDALRYHVKKQDELGKKAQNFMDAGDLVPDNLLLKVLESEFSRLETDYILLDGFPRNTAQAEALSAMKGHSVVLAVHLDLKFEVLEARLIKRKTIEGRSDDVPEKIKNRFKIYENQTAPIIQYYKDKGLYRSINADQGEEGVFEELKEVFNKEGLV